jgi:hypothetical protein
MPVLIRVESANESVKAVARRGVGIAIKKIRTRMINVRGRRSQ